jgi:hypothetical protein
VIVNAFDVRHDVIVNRCVVIGVSRFLRVSARNEEQGSDERAREAMLKHAVFSLGACILMTMLSHISLCKKCHVYKREAKNYSTIYTFI